MNPEEAEAALMAAVRNVGHENCDEDQVPCPARAAVRAAYRQAVIAELEALMCHYQIKGCANGEYRDKRDFWCDRCIRIAELLRVP